MSTTLETEKPLPLCYQKLQSVFARFHWVAAMDKDYHKKIRRQEGEVIQMSGNAEYQVQRDGSLRRTNKPLSRRKRLRLKSTARGMK